MKILLKNNDLNEALSVGSNVGFVPTMGSLHKGHISLIKRSLNYCNKTIVSIFVNPKQFNNKNDYKRYPRNLKKDLKILKKLKVNFVYTPNKKQIYYSKNKTKIQLAKKDKILCAKYRKGHFEGVIDVMTRLTKILKPSKIFMGEKDFQQLFLVKKIRLNSPFTAHIIIEAENIEQAKEAVLAGADSVLLDELSPEIIKKNVQDLRDLSMNSLKKEVNKNLIIEVSGINPKEISKYLIKGIDLISTSSSITKSNWIDLSMRYIN